MPTVQGVNPEPVSQSSASQPPSLETVSSVVSSVPPVEPKSDKSQLLTKLALVFLVLAFLGLVGSLVKGFISSRKKEVACTMEAKVCPDGTSVGRVAPSCEFAPCPSPTSTPDETANWKTYTDENIKVQFKYPSNWKDEVINSKSNAGFNYTQITLAKIEYFDPIPKGKPLIMITVSNTINQDLLSVYQNTKITGSTKVDNIPAEVRQHNSTSVDSKYITFTKGEQSFEIESRLHTQSVEQELILDQILSTFKFLEATPSATPQ